MNNTKKPSKEERYRYVHQYTDSDGVVETLEEPIKIDLMPERIGKIENIADSYSLFYKFYMGKFHDLVAACSKDGDCLVLIEFVLHCLDKGRYQTVSLSKENFSEIMGWSKPKLDKVLNILIKHKLIHVCKIYRSFHFLVNPDAIWQWADNLKWRTNKAIEGEYKYIKSNVIMKEEDIEMYKHRIIDIKSR